jgi:class 3 adenylate cyclase
LGTVPASLAVTVARSRSRSNSRSSVLSRRRRSISPAISTCVIAPSGIPVSWSTCVWFSDLRGFTRITDSAPEQVIPLLNDYADVIVSAIHAQGGDVLKLIGDGILAIFTAADRAHACAAALVAATAARTEVTALNVRRARDGLPVTDMYLGLNVGEVFYGNVGSTERLGFTVVGPAVNEASRIAAMCRSVEQPVRSRRRSPMLMESAAGSFLLAATRCGGSHSRKSFSRWIPLKPVNSLPRHGDACSGSSSPVTLSRR